jgi:hypothetical protein
MPQTAEDFFSGVAPPPQTGGSGNTLPTAQEFFGTADTSQANYSGPAHDAFWAATEEKGARILNAFGQGFEYGWGSQPLGVSQEDESALAKAGIFNDYKTGNESFMKTVNEAFMRPAIAGADFALRATRSALFYAPGAALEQTAREMQPEHPQGFIPSPVPSIVGEAGEILGSIPEGFIPEMGIPHAASALNLDEVNKARALGVIGEGEKGFHEVEPLSPENMQARSAAARETGLPEPVSPPQAPDIHAVARSVDPGAFEQFDALAAERDKYKAVLDQIGAERENLPEAKEAQTQIDTILGKVNGVEDRLTNAARDRLQAAQDTLERIYRTDTPDMQEARLFVQEANYQLQPLFTRVQAAYRQAQELMPKPEPGILAEGAENAEAAPPKGPETTTGAKQPEPSPESPQGAPRVIPAEEAAKGTVGIEGAQTAPEVGPAADNLQPKLTTPRYGALRAVEGTGELKARGLSEGVEAKAIENSLTQNFGDLPEYRQLSMADQAEKASEIVNSDYDRAKNIAMGQRQAPKGILPESVFVAVEKRALAEGDVETLRGLATRSRLSTEATTMGQRIRTLGERDPASPVGAITEVQKAREAAYAARGGEDIKAATEKAVSEIKTEVRKAASTKQDWNAFIQSIKCE